MPIVNGKNVGLLDFSEDFRKANKQRNKYKQEDQYRKGHPNAISDGDELGKGENGGSIGGQTDILMRQTLEAKNRYNKNNPYDSSKV